MKCKIKALFISIALSILAGSLVYSNNFTSQAGEIPFGTLAETLNIHNSFLDLEEASISEYQIAIETNECDALRHFSQTKRVNSSSASKCGLAFIKKNYTLYTSTLKFESPRRFPSRLTEARQYLISLGKLII